MAQPGQVTYNAEFSADTEPAKQSLRDYQRQIRAVRDEIKSQSRSAKDDYNSQMLAAKASGASVTELTKIQQQYAQTQLALKGTQKQLTDEILRGNYAALESEKALDVVRKQALATLEQQTAAARALASTNSGHSISNQIAASGTVQLLDGRGGIRTIESFLGNTLGLGGFFSMMFPVVGAIQSAKLLFDLGEKVYEVGDAAAHAGQKINEAFSALHDKAVVNIDDLNVQADKLQLSIDKLSGHPGNGLQLAIDQAKLSADKLLQSLVADRKEIEAIFTANKVSVVGTLLTGVAGTSVQSKQLLADNKSLSGSVEEANSTFNAESANAKSLDDIKAAGSKRDNAIRSAIQQTINTYRTEAKRLQAEQDKSGDVAAGRSVSGGYVAPIDNSAKIANVNGVASRYQDMINVLNAQSRIASLTEQDNQLKGDKESGTAASEASRRALEQQKQAAQAQAEQWSQDLAAQQSAGKLSAAAVHAFWVDRQNESVRGSQQYIVAERKGFETLKTLNDENQRNMAESIKWRIQLQTDAEKQARGIIPANDPYAKGIASASVSGRALTDAQSGGRYQVAEASIQYDVATGRISKLDAAMQLQTLHADKYAEALADLQDKLAAVQAGPEADTQRNEINRQITDLNTRRTIEAMRDNGDVTQNTVAGALRQANQQWLQNTQSLGPQIASVYGNIFSGLNDQLTDLMTGQKTSWASFFGSLASQFAKIGLNQLEAPFMSAASSGSKSSAGGIGSIFKSIPIIGGLFGGFRAAGGPVEAGKTYIVGEQGPEPVTFGSSGRMGTARDLASMGNGDTNHYYSINVPSGITPEQFHQSMAQIIPGVQRKATEDAVRAVSERSKRRPSVAAR